MTRKRISHKPMASRGPPATTADGPPKRARLCADGCGAGSDGNAAASKVCTDVVMMDAALAAHYSNAWSGLSDVY